MTANHAYILYTYQSGSTISALSYTYTENITPVPDDKECVKITALYNSDGSLKDVKTENILVKDIEVVNNTDLQKVFYWESLESMKPVIL